MIIQLLQKGEKFLLRRYLLGFIPVYWDNGYDGGWWITRAYFSYRNEAEDVAKDLIDTYKRKKKFRESPMIVLATFS